MQRKLSLLAPLMALAASGVAAQTVAPVPSLMNFQGRLAKPDGTPVADGVYSIRFSLWDAATGGNEKWNQTVSPVNVRNGTFATLLNVGSGPSDLFADNRWLEIKIGTNAPLTNRQQLVSVAFALKANTVPDNSITAAKIADGTITATKLSTGLTVTPGGAAGGDLTGIYPNPTLATLGTSLYKVSGTLMSATNTSLTVDQSQTNAPLLITDYGWQSFTPAANSKLTSLDIWIGTSTGVAHGATLTIYAGEGNTGTVLQSQTVNVQPTIGFQHFDLSTSVALAAGLKYTYSIGSYAPLRLGYSTGNPYPNGKADAGDTLDYAFRTYIQASASSQLTALAPFLFSNTTQASERFRLSGQEYYQASNTSADGISFILGLNRANNRQLWIMDSARLTPNMVNSSLQLSPGGDLYPSAINAMSSDGNTPQTLTLQPGGGSLGIGTYSPTTKLDVNGNLSLTDTGSIAIAFKGNGEISADTGIGHPGDGQLTFWADAGEQMRLKGGNFGIGTNNPEKRLHVAGDVLLNNTNILYGKNSAGANEGVLWPRWSDNGTYLNFGTGGFFIRSNDSIPRMFVTNSGNVGIGTTSPGAKFDVRGGSAVVTNASGANRVISGLNTGVDAGYFQIINGNNNLIAGFGGDNNGGSLYVRDGANATKFSVDASGYVNAANGGSFGNVTLHNAGNYSAIRAYNSSPIVNGVSYPTIYAQNYSGGLALFAVGAIGSSIKNFIIDHPLDPGNKYLVHASVESDKAQNMYNGTVKLDAEGKAWVKLPDWFEALNKDFTYQLTCIGGYAQVYIAHEVKDNQFQIAGGGPNMKVSWQVTGVRHDAYINAYPMSVVQDKGADRGKYLNPVLFGQPASKGGVMQAPAAPITPAQENK